MNRRSFFGAIAAAPFIALAAQEKKAVIKTTYQVELKPPTEEEMRQIISEAIAQAEASVADILAKRQEIFRADLKALNRKAAGLLAGDALV